MTHVADVGHASGAQDEGGFTAGVEFVRAVELLMAKGLVACLALASFVIATHRWKCGTEPLPRYGNAMDFGTAA